MEQARFNMIEQQIRPWDVLDHSVLQVMSDLPRDAFVFEAQKSLAYADIQLPIGHGESMMHPRVEGRVLQELAIQDNDICLEIGTGSGYLKVVDGTLKDLFDQDRDALLIAMAADGIVPTNPNAIDPEADVYIKFSFGPPGQGGFQLRSEDPAYGATPEPATIILMGSSLMLIAAAARKKFVKK